MKQFNNKKYERRKKIRKRKKILNFTFCFFAALLLLSPLFIPWKSITAYAYNSKTSLSNTEVVAFNTSTSYNLEDTDEQLTQVYESPKYGEPVFLTTEEENNTNNTSNANDTEYNDYTEYSTNSTIDSALYAYFDTSNISQNELNYLAKLVHFEFCGGGHEGRCAVANVVINRIVDGRMGNSIYSVIQRDRQFVPYSLGLLETDDVCIECYEAVIDVLYNNYRILPIYVLYFQSLSDGYFKGHNTFIEIPSTSGISTVYFSYKISDKELYENKLK